MVWEELSILGKQYQQNQNKETKKQIVKGPDPQILPQ